VNRTVAPPPPTEEITESANSMWDTFVEALPRVGVAAATVLIAWMLSRLLRWGLLGVLRRRRTASFANVMSKLSGWLFLGIGVSLAIAVTFPSVRPVDLLAGLGFFSVAVGFAFQDILENTLAGVLLLFRQPFASGDQITVVDQSGTVVEINLRETRLATFDGESLVIPNRDVYKSVIRVHTYTVRHALSFDVGISHDADAQLAKQLAVDALQTVDGVEATPPPMALLTDLQPSSVNVRVVFSCNSRKLESVLTLDRAITAVKDAFRGADIPIPAGVVAVESTPSLEAALADLTAAGAHRR
jgi:small-conductance mechanosensitive channel